VVQDLHSEKDEVLQNPVIAHTYIHAGASKHQRVGRRWPRHSL